MGSKLLVHLDVDFYSIVLYFHEFSLAHFIVRIQYLIENMLGDLQASDQQTINGETNYMWIFDSTGISTPKPHVIQGSTELCNHPFTIIGIF